VTPRVLPAGDAALIVEFEDAIDPAVNARAIAIGDRVRAAAYPGVRDVVPTYRSVAVYFDPLTTDSGGLHQLLHREAAHEGPAADRSRAPVRVPVCYGGDLGPDLESVAQYAGLAREEVIRLHASGVYRVFMLGFVPGFAYMGALDPRIAAPRLDTPRVRVPAGSVGIAGAQTGIYPTATPGGWRLIGRTPVRPFDAARTPPFLFAAGDTVQFYPIDRSAYDAWRGAAPDPR
jgi:inhibitor of KinA